MLTIKIIVASIAFTFYFIEMARIPDKITILKRKPFNCVMCLSVWTSLALFFAPVIVTNIILVMFGTGVLAPFIRNFLHNLMFTK
jgi:hypothetical protein